MDIISVLSKAIPRSWNVRILIADPSLISLFFFLLLSKDLHLITFNYFFLDVSDKCIKAKRGSWLPEREFFSIPLYELRNLIF